MLNVRKYDHLHGAKKDKYKLQNDSNGQFGNQYGGDIIENFHVYSKSFRSWRVNVKSQHFGTVEFRCYSLISYGLFSVRIAV